MFFIRHNGGAVWLDDLGWPWPVHGCFERLRNSGRALDSVQRVAKDTVKVAPFIMLGAVAIHARRGACDEIEVTMAAASQSFCIRPLRLNLTGSLVLVRVDRSFTRIVQVADLQGKAIPRADSQPELPGLVQGGLRTRFDEVADSAAHRPATDMPLQEQYWWESRLFPVPIDASAFEAVIRQVLNAAHTGDEALVTAFEMRLKRLYICDEVFVFIPESVSESLPRISLEWQQWLEGSTSAALLRRGGVEMLLHRTYKKITDRLKDFKEFASDTESQIISRVETFAMKLLFSLIAAR